jgi:hypothetical protein
METMMFLIRFTSLESRHRFVPPKAANRKRMHLSVADMEADKPVYIGIAGDGTPNVKCLVFPVHCCCWLVCPECEQQLSVFMAYDEIAIQVAFVASSECR